MDGRKKKSWFPLAVSVLVRELPFFHLSVHLSILFPSHAPPPSPEASTSRRPPSRCRVHAGPYGVPWDAQPEGGPCAAQFVGVRGDVWKAMRSGSHWAGDAGPQAAPGPAQAQSGQWWEGPHDGQS